MSVERRVKPPRKVKNKTRSASNIIVTNWKKVVAVVLVVVLLISTFAIVAPLIPKRSKTPKKTTAEEDAIVTRNIIATRTSYEGEWVEEPDGLFQVYLPGDNVEEKGYNSVAFSYDRETDYDNTCLRAYGVIVGEEEFDIAVVDDPATIFGTVKDKLGEDIAKVCYGKYPSAAYDMEFVTMKDGRDAIRISGDITMSVLYKENKDSSATYQDVLTRNLQAYLTLERGIPVLVWACWNPFDYFVDKDTPGLLEEMANTLLLNKKLLPVPEWTPIDPETLKGDDTISQDSGDKSHIHNEDSVQDDQTGEVSVESDLSSSEGADSEVTDGAGSADNT